MKKPACLLPFGMVRVRKASVFLLCIASVLSLSICDIQGLRSSIEQRVGTGGTGGGGGGGVSTFSVTYEANGATGGSVPTDNNNYQQGATVTVLGNTGNLVKAGFTFAGWNTKADGTGTSYAGGATFSMGAANVILYAVWTQYPTYTVSYNDNGATTGNVPTDGNNYLQGATVTVLGNNGGLVKTGYVFTGWNTAANGSGTTYTQGQTFTIGTSNVTLFAVWSTAYNVSYDANGATSGSAPTDSNSYRQGDTVTVQGNPGSLARTGWTFGGWNTISDRSGQTYAQAQQFTIGTSNVTLYAKWVITGYTIFAATNNGIAISADGGASWTNKTTANGLGSNTVYDVCASGVNVLAGTASGVAISGDGGTSWANHTGNGLGSNIVYGVSYFAAPTIPCASTAYGFASSNDSGATWTNLTTPSLVNNVVYAAVDTPMLRYYATAGGLTVFRAMGGYSDYLVGTIVHHVFGVGTTLASTNSGLYVSTDGFNTSVRFLSTSDVMGGYAVDSAHIYAATTTGLQITINGGNSWTNYTTSGGLASNTVNGVFVTNSVIYAATSGGISISADAGGSWINCSTANGLGSNVVSRLWVQ
jgi:uncharacterized repeat protein (TIGR02543 family)